jgi:hypothetical protein
MLAHESLTLLPDAAGTARAKCIVTLPIERCILNFVLDTPMSHRPITAYHGSSTKFSNQHHAELCIIATEKSCTQRRHNSATSAHPLFVDGASRKYLVSSGNFHFNCPHSSYILLNLLLGNTYFDYPIMASIAAFQPHGLIQTPIQQQLYFKAHIANIYAGVSNPKETETVALMEVILNKNLFTEAHFIVNSQQPPTPTSDRRCDLVVRYLESGYANIRTLLFAECKRTSTSQAFSLKALEQQAKDYCQLHLEYETDSTFVYAATMAGAHVRLWTYRLGQDP